jgi:hypothetical protein
MKYRELTHSQIQRSVFQHLRERGAPDIFAFHPKNEGADMVGKMGAIQYGLGMEPGIPDVIVLKRATFPSIGTLTKVYALELKKESERGKSNNHTDRQEGTRARMTEAGCWVDVAYGLNEALRWLEEHGLLRGNSNA